MAGIKETHFYLTGISHKTAEVEVREKVSFSSDIIGDVLKGIHAIEGVNECVVLSTCNRTEIYTVSSKPEKDIHKQIVDFILNFTGQNETLVNHFYYLRGANVFEHLFKVASGLDSMILGEPQIFGQVKNAYSTACDFKCTGPATNRLFHHAFKVGKIIRHKTSVGEGAVSVSYAAVELARKTFVSLEGLSVLLIGAGKIGELCAIRLVKSGINNLYISNRTDFKAVDLADRLSVKTIPFEDLTSSLSGIDIVISSVAACKPILKTSEIIQRSPKPLFVIDLGVPRNIEPDITADSHILLYNIDDLEDVIYGNRDKRKNEARTAEKIILEEVDNFRTWLLEREVIPVIQNLRKEWEKIRLQELDKAKNTISPEAFDTLDMVSRRMIRKILHNPIINVRAAASDNSCEHLLEVIDEVFLKKKNE
ncbi:MAG: glutamyl-tRNA reductase [Candidatus Latescibacteria bacterium]|nr:glutamyl-tRNA reductase [Candidatus Latescibacterota bacterium]